ncbi:MAG: beta-ketoacyl-ACP synthase II [Pseudomonadales bacterium]|nr:beta-ketoacyl-ACP synthase II [Pseudomonadales bacterium]
MSRRRVVVTGLGMITAFGDNVEDTWQRLLNGESAISRIDKFDVSKCAVKFGGTIKNFDVEAYMSKRDARRMDGFVQYGIAAAQQAVNDSGVVATELDAHRMGVVIGSGIGGITTIEEQHDVMLKGGARRVSPFFVPGTITNIIAGHVSIRHGFKGPNYCITTACTTGTHNIGHAARAIAYDEADVMLAGGAEMGSSPLGMAGFAAARALSTRNDDPAAASRPWDKDRDGFVLADGAGVVVLEEYEHAKNRGAKIYGEWVGLGMSGDAHHITLPPENGEGAALAMKNALNDAKLNPESIQYINAHGTSTLAGDVAETRAIRSVFGVFADTLTVSSTKSMTGHLLGAAGAIETVFSLLAIRDQVAPPTINLDEAGEGCDLNYVPHQAQEMKIDAVLSNSFGFGGTNASLIFKKV